MVASLRFNDASHIVAGINLHVVVLEALAVLITQSSVGFASRCLIRD